MSSFQECFAKYYQALPTRYVLTTIELFGNIIQFHEIRVKKNLTTLCYDQQTLGLQGLQKKQQQDLPQTRYVRRWLMINNRHHPLAILILVIHRLTGYSLFTRNGLPFFPRFFSSSYFCFNGEKELLKTQLSRLHDTVMPNECYTLTK